MKTDSLFIWSTTHSSLEDFNQGFDAAVTSGALSLMIFAVSDNFYDETQLSHLLRQSPIPLLAGCHPARHQRIEDVLGALAGRHTHRRSQIGQGSRQVAEVGARLAAWVRRGTPRCPGRAGAEGLEPR